MVASTSAPLSGNSMWGVFSGTRMKSPLAICWAVPPSMPGMAAVVIVPPVVSVPAPSSTIINSAWVGCTAAGALPTRCSRLST